MRTTRDPSESSEDEHVLPPTLNHLPPSAEAEQEQQQQHPQEHSETPPAAASSLSSSVPIRTDGNVSPCEQAADSAFWIRLVKERSDASEKERREAGGGGDDDLHSISSVVAIETRGSSSTGHGGGGGGGLSSGDGRSPCSTTPSGSGPSSRSGSISDDSDSAISVESGSSCDAYRQQRLQRTEERINATSSSRPSLPAHAAAAASSATTSPSLRSNHVDETQHPRRNTTTHKVPADDDVIYTRLVSRSRTSSSKKAKSASAAATTSTAQEQQGDDISDDVITQAEVNAVIDTTPLPGWLQTAKQYLEHEVEKADEFRTRVFPTVEEHMSSFRSVMVLLTLHFSPGMIVWAVYAIVTAGEGGVPTVTSSIVFGCSIIGTLSLCHLPMTIYQKFFSDGRNPSLIMLDYLFLASCVQTILCNMAYCVWPGKELAVIMWSMTVVCHVDRVGRAEVMTWIMFACISCVYIICGYNNSMLSAQGEDSSWSLLTAGSVEPRRGAVGENWVVVGAHPIFLIMFTSLIFIMCNNFINRSNRVTYVVRLCNEMEELIVLGDFDALERKFDLYNRAANAAELVFPIYLSSIFRTLRSVSPMLPMKMIRRESRRRNNNNNAATTTTPADDVDDPRNSNVITNNHNNNSYRDEPSAFVAFDQQHDHTLEDRSRHHHAPDDHDHDRHPERQRGDGSLGETVEYDSNGGGGGAHEGGGVVEVPPPAMMMNKSAFMLPCTREKSNVTILHADIAKMDELFWYATKDDGVASVVRSLMSAIVDIILDHRGTVVEIQENGTVVAMWDDLSGEDDALLADSGSDDDYDGANANHNNNANANDNRYATFPDGGQPGPTLSANIDQQPQRTSSARAVGVDVAERRRRRFMPAHGAPFACCSALHIVAASQSPSLAIPVTMRIGIHTGPALVGTFGGSSSSSGKTYTAIGQAPLFAHALAAFNLRFTGTTVIASNEVVELAQNASIALSSGNNGAGGEPPFMLATRSLASVRLPKSWDVIVATQILGIVSNHANAPSSSPSPSSSSSSSPSFFSRVQRHCLAHLPERTPAPLTCDVLEVLHVMDCALMSFELERFAEAASRYVQANAKRSALDASTRGNLISHGVTKEQLLRFAELSAFYARKGKPAQFRNVVVLSESS